MCLTSSSDRHPSHHERGRALDLAAEERYGVVEAGYDDLGKPAALVGHQAVGDQATSQAPL